MSIIEVLAISAALHGVAIAWIGQQPHEDRLHAFSLPELPTIAPKEIEPTTVVLLDDHTVVPTGHSNATRGRTRATKSHQAVISTEATGQGPGEVKRGGSVLAMRGTDDGPSTSLERGPSGAFMSRFLANSKPLPTPIEKSGELKPDGQGAKSEHRTFTMKVAPDGTVDIHDAPNLKREGLGASFDLTDAAMRYAGQDPYSSYKLKVLDKTRDERVAMGKQYRTQQLARSREIMQRNIERLTRATRDAELLKQGLFELWDDCAEAGTDELVVAGRAAREQVMGYIRSHVRYTADDVARLNKLRRSKMRFEP